MAVWYRILSSEFFLSNLVIATNKQSRQRTWHAKSICIDRHDSMTNQQSGKHMGRQMKKAQQGMS